MKPGACDVWTIVQDPTDERVDEKQSVARVLIVDHDEHALLVLRRLLEGMHCHVTTARSGLKAMQLLDHDGFDFVLLDDQLPDTSEEEIVRQIAYPGAGTPVVVMQGLPAADDSGVQFARSGACFFMKRRDPEAIAEIVRDYFSRPRPQCAHFSAGTKYGY